MAQEYDPMKVKRLTGRITSIESCTQLPIDLVGGMSYEVRRDGNLGKEIIYTALRLVAFASTSRRPGWKCSGSGSEADIHG